MVSEILTGYRRQWTDADCIRVVDFLRGIVRIISFETGCVRACVRVYMRRPRVRFGHDGGAMEEKGSRRWPTGVFIPALVFAHKPLRPLASHICLPSSAEFTPNLDCSLLDPSVRRR